MPAARYEKTPRWRYGMGVSGFVGSGSGKLGSGGNILDYGGEMESGGSNGLSMGSSDGSLKEAEATWGRSGHRVLGIR